MLAINTGASLIIRSSFQLSRIADMRLFSLLLLSLVLLTACGQRGPLYLPDRTDASREAN